jgi:hypothetical protein
MSDESTRFFIRGFMENSSKKRRYGHYYVLTNEDKFKFLLHHNPKKKASKRRRTRWSRSYMDGKDFPYLLAIRDPNGQILICFENHRMLEKYYPLTNIYHYFKLEILESVRGLDITNFRHIHSKLVLPEDEEHRAVYVSLYEIDGTRFLADMRVSPEGLTLERWLKFDDYQMMDRADLICNIGLQAVKGLPTTCETARAQMVPEEIVDFSLTVHGRAILKRVLASEAEYDAKVYDELIIPAINGVVPTVLVRNGGLLDLIKDNPLEQLISSRKVALILEYIEKMKVYNKALKNYRNLGIEADAFLHSLEIASAGDVRLKDDKLYVSEFVVTEHPISTASRSWPIAMLGDAWYRVYPFNSYKV